MGWEENIEKVNNKVNGDGRKERETEEKITGIAKFCISLSNR